MVEKFLKEVDEWYSDRHGQDEELVGRTERLLGLEKAIFASAMRDGRAVIDAVFSEGDLHETDDKVKIAIADSAHKAIWSAWCEMLAARYGAAISHLRSIGESPEYLRAIAVKPQLARRWIDQQLKIERVRKVLRDALRDEGGAQFAKELMTDRTEVSRPIQRLAHVTLEASVAGIPVEFDEDGQPVGYLLGNVVDERLVRLIALQLAYQALLLAGSFVFSFQSKASVAKLRDDGLYDRVRIGIDGLVEIMGTPEVLLALRRTSNVAVGSTR